MPTTKRNCQAVVDIEFAGEVNTILTCGLPEYDKPFKPYVPLCAAHRTMAEVKEIKVYMERVIAGYRL